MLMNRAALGRLTIGLSPRADACVRFAASELQRYLAAMSGEPALAPICLEESVSLPENVLRLGKGPLVQASRADDGFAIGTDESGVTLAGASGRAVLHAAYRLLEDLGCTWSFDGQSGETVPVLPAEGRRVCERREEPRYRVRAYSTDIHTYHYHEADVMAARAAADFAFTDWMAKTGANAFLFIRHPFDSQLTIPELLPEFERRGIEPEYGGHVLPLLLPRDHFADHPDWFPADDHGRRIDLGNLCSSNLEALDVVGEAAVRYAREHPEMQVLHIWGADLWEGGWCRCSACAGTSVQDQSLRVCNAVAEALERAGLTVRVCYLAYHDTLDPDLRISPHPNVIAEFAPRERCYGHSIGDPACEINPRYRQAFDRHIEIFEGRVRVFEYYGDAILFCGIVVPLMKVIEDDLAYYHRTGAREISFLQFGSYSLWAHPLNFVRYAEAVRHATSESAEKPDHGCGPYPADYWTSLQTAMAKVVTYGDIRRPPRSRAAEIGRCLEEALAVLRAWIPRLHRDPWMQRSLLEYTAAVLEGVRLQLAGTAAATAEAEGRYQRALDIVRAVDDHHVGVWGKKNLPVIHSFYSAAWRRS